MDLSILCSSEIIFSLAGRTDKACRPGGSFMLETETLHMQDPSCVQCWVCLSSEIAVSGVPCCV